MKLPKVDDPRIISERSEIILRNCLAPEHWGLIKIDQENDYGLDFRIERREQGHNTGKDFFVQLKGFEKNNGKKYIGLRIETSTINYWKSKLIPILLVAVDCSKNIAYCEWFNPAMAIDNNQQTITITIPRNKFNNESIASFIDDYYKSFRSAIKDNELRRIITKIFQDSLLQANAASEGFVSLTFAREITDQDQRKTAIQHTFYALSLVFVGFARYVPNVVKVLDKTGFSGNLSAHLSTLAQFFQDVFILTTSDAGMVEPQKVQPGAVELFFCNQEKILKSLPYLISTFNALNRELARHLLNT